MARFIQPLIASNFATGATRYDDFHPGEEHLARVVLTVIVDGHLTVQAIVDTGAPWCILAPEITERLGMSEHIDYTPEEELLIRGTRYVGNLFRMRIGLLADYGGEDLEVDATVFVPTLHPGESWYYPNFIGLDGFLNRIRFAVDPEESAFYFGPL